MPIFIAGIAWAVGDVMGVFNPSNVANIAHLSGMFFGLIMGAFYKHGMKEVHKRSNRVSYEISEERVRDWERNWH